MNGVNKYLVKILSVIAVLCCFAMNSMAETTYQIMKLSTPTITIAGKSLKKGDSFKGTSNIRWADDKQVMEVKDVKTGNLYKFSKKVFDSKGAVLSITDFFLRTNKASSRDTEPGVALTKSPVADKFPERRIALVIGNSNYFNLSYLRNAQKDASDIADILLDLGFDVVQAYETNYEEMKTALNRFSGLAGNYDVALFYFAGHGLQDEGKNYLIPINAELEFRSELRSLLQCDDVMQRMSATGAPTQLIFIDACRNAKNSWSRDTSEGLARMEGEAGAVIVFSTQSGKVALDGDGDNSPFALSLLQNLSKSSASFSETMNGVVRDTYQATDQKQYPLIVGTLLTDFNFNPGNVSVAAPNIVSQPKRMEQPVEKTSRPESAQPVARQQESPSNAGRSSELVEKGKKLVKTFKPEQAVGLFLEAASNGNTEACYQLAELYYTGNGVAKNFVRAKEYYLKAAEGGNVESQYMLGVMARNGQGGEKDFSEARKWLTKAAQQGHTGAKNMLQQIK